MKNYFHFTMQRAWLFWRGMGVFTPLQNLSKYKKVVFKQDMIYMNWEVIWSATIPYVGLSWARIAAAPKQCSLFDTILKTAFIG